MNQRIASSLLTVLLSTASVIAHANSAAAPERQGAPADGWAGQQGGTRGGAAATDENIFTVRTRAELLAALGRTGAARIIKVAARIDMAEAAPFASSADQAARGLVRLGSNTTLIGAGPDAGFVNAHIQIADATQVIVRNLHIRNPCDVGPVWDPKDGPTGEWNSLFDGISVSASTHVWIDHNSFTDAPVTDDQAAIANGRPKQCHDGSLDIAKGSDFVTVSYNRFDQHEKNMLIGSSDKATGDAGKLNVSISNNVFTHVGARSPRVRFGQVHVFNNYYAGERKHPVYPHVYSIGAGKQAKIISHNNAFDIAGATTCEHVARNPAASAPAGAFADSGSLLNGNPLGACTLATDVLWSVPYKFTPLPAEAVKSHALANAGAGRLPGSGVVAVGAGALVLLKEEQLAAIPAGDYFVEARIRPLPGNSGQLFLLGRYADEHNWFGAGINITDGSPTLQVELSRKLGGKLERLKQVKRGMASDGRALTVRLEMIGKALTVYLNGERVTTAIDASLSARGLAGMYATGKAFEVDNVRVGDPARKPMRLAPSLASSRFIAQAGDAPSLLAVSAIDADGVTRTAFSARSSDPAVLTVDNAADGILVQPKAPGTAFIVLTSSADPSVQSIIDAAIGPAFSAPARRYQLRGALQPAAGARAVQVDTTLRLAFDHPPTLHGAGSVRIFRQADDALVDVIRPGEEVAAIGYPGQDQSRYVRHTPISIDGNTLVIKPHPHRLNYADAYYVAIEPGVVSGATIGGKPFDGMGKAAGWTFRTRAAPPKGSLLTVDDNGPADFRTVQGALNHAMRHYSQKQALTVLVRNGRYDEMLFIRAKDNLTLRGQSRNGVLIHNGNNDGYNPGSGVSQAPGSPAFSGGRSLLMVEAADLLTIENLTMKNTTLRSGKVAGQAETVYFNAENGRLVARNATFISEQDTIQVKGYAWFYRTLVAGNVDFIWGYNRAALFEESEIRSLGDSANPASGGFVVQARTVDAGDPGFVFLNSRLTHGAGPLGNDVPRGTTYLARSPGTAATWDNVSYINCKMGPHVAAAGWAGLGVLREPAPNPATASAVSGWREFGSMDLAGKPLDLGARVGGYLLGAAEVAQRFSSRAAIFAGYDGGRGWNPRP